MEATIKINYTPQSAVPRKGRVSWLDRYGPPAATGTLTITLSLADWARTGAKIAPDGSVDSPVRQPYINAVLKLILETGDRPDELPEPILQAVVDKLAAEHTAKIAKAAAAKAKAAEVAAAKNQDLIDGAPDSLIIGRPWRVSARHFSDADPRICALAAEAEPVAKRREQETVDQEVAERKVQAQEVLTWIAEHGSERLQLADSLDLTDAMIKVYRRERMALERPGWDWDTEGENHKILGPSLEALTALAKARQAHGKAVELVWLAVGHDCTDDCDYDCAETGRKGPALVADFMGGSIIREI